MRPSGRAEQVEWLKWRVQPVLDKRREGTQAHGIRESSELKQRSASSRLGHHPAAQPRPEPWRNFAQQSREVVAWPQSAGGSLITPTRQADPPVAVAAWPRSGSSSHRRWPEDPRSGYEGELLEHPPSRREGRRRELEHTDQAPRIARTLDEGAESHR